MNHFIQGWLVLMFLSLIVDAQAKERDRDQAFEQEILAQLKAEAPKAVKVFEQANAAREKKDFEKAFKLYERVRKMAPKFVHATRRLCSVELERGNREAAIQLCRQALSQEASAENLGALALALIYTQGQAGPSNADSTEAMELVKKSAGLKPEDVYVQATVCQVSVANKNLLQLAQCVRKLNQIAPGEVSTHVFGLLANLYNGDLAKARESLEQAKKLGLEPEDYDGLSRLIESLQNNAPAVAAENNPFDPEVRSSSSGFESMVSNGLWGLLLWAGALLGLLIFGWILSGLTLRSARRIPTNTKESISGLDALIRRIYRMVLWICCGYYYVSIPVVLLLVVVVGGGVIYGFFAIGRIPIKLVVLIGIVVLVTVFAVLKSLFVRRVDDDPGSPMDLSKEPRLKGVLEEVAQKIQTRPVDNVYLTPGTEIAVMERGGMGKQLTGRNERCLILGVAVLDGMKVGQFKSILAHEYGHFSNKDTAGGGFALAVRRSLLTMVESLARGGAATWYNPAWWFVNGFFRVFLRISQGASRLQEVLADRLAVFAYGAKAFEQGLRHTIHRSINFDFHLEHTLKEVVENKLPLANLYAFIPKQSINPQMVAGTEDSVIHAKASPYDSHPSPEERFRMVQALAAIANVPEPTDMADVWSLFGDPKFIQERMTGLVRVNLAMRGVVVKEA